MGWLYMTSLKGHAGPRQYLDSQFNCEDENRTQKILKSALVKMRTYYAAAEIVHKITGDRMVFALVCLVRYNTRDKEGYIFGYKDMSESMGPCEAECPKAILALLTPTENEYALEWRDRCWAAATKSLPRPGMVITFLEPLRFTDNMSHSSFVVTASPYNPRLRIYRAVGTNLYYKIGNIKHRAYTLAENESKAQCQSESSTSVQQAELQFR